MKRGIFILEVINARICYGKKIILQNVSFTAEIGAGTAIFGRNGSGKSTFLKAISGVLKADEGSVLLNGKSVYVKGTRRGIGFIPQNDISIGDLSVLDNLLFWGASCGLSKINIVNNRAIELLGLSEVLKKKARTLSGGTRKRLCIAASILHDPDVLILDEPFSELDVIARGGLIEYFKQIKSDGKTLILTGHNTAELTDLCESYFFIAEKTIEPILDVKGFNADPDACIEKIIRRGY